jgi:hypothetical protein
MSAVAEGLVCSAMENDLLIMWDAVIVNRTARNRLYQVKHIINLNTRRR